MIKKLRTIALGTVAIAAVIVLFTTGPEVAQVWSQAANAQTPLHSPGYLEQQALRSIALTPEEKALIVNKAILLFGVNLPFGHESPTFIQNVSQLAKEGFDSPQNAKLFLQLDSIALNASSSHPGHVTLTTPTIKHIISVSDEK